MCLCQSVCLLLCVSLCVFASKSESPPVSSSMAECLIVASMTECLHGFAFRYELLGIFTTIFDLCLSH